MLGRGVGSCRIWSGQVSSRLSFCHQADHRGPGSVASGRGNTTCMKPSTTLSLGRYVACTGMKKAVAELKKRLAFRTCMSILLYLACFEKIPGITGVRIILKAYNRPAS